MVLAFEDEIDETEKEARRRRKTKTKKKTRRTKLHLLRQQKSSNWWEDHVVVIAFNLPRISARLERLMGTNVVRLTDRKYMKELRQRMQEDYIHSLNKRIEARELKELERERNLILEGKTDIIPEALANHPIFIVNKKVNNLIAKRRAKMKTKREKNAEKLLRQGAKWERERLIYLELDKLKEDEIKRMIEEQKTLEEKYKEEDEKLGTNLLRIHNRNYIDCEMDLKEFLERERARMKARSMKIPTQFTSDPMDISNIVRKRQKFREMERKIRMELEEKYKTISKKQQAKEILARAAATSEMSRQLADEPSQEGAYIEDIHLSQEEIAESDENLSDISIHKTIQQLSQSESTYLTRTLASMEEDVLKGFLVSKVQFDESHYSDPRVARLKLTDKITELYILAEEIITEEPRSEDVEEEELGEEEDEDAFL